MPRSATLRALALMSVLAAGLTAAPALAQKGAPARNLLANPGFERSLPGHDWLPTAWDTSQAGIPTVFFGRDSFLVRSGDFAVNIANTSTIFPMAHNWSQTVAVGPEAWGKLARFRVWTRSNGLQGRAYLLVQAYRDTITRLAKDWNVDREEARKRLRVNKVDDPAMDLAWHRTQFDDPLTDWVLREASVVVPPLTNVLFVRAGIFGTGQLLVDDASLTLEAAPPLKRPVPGVNLIADASFEEGSALRWEIAVPPYEGARIDVDSTVARTGKRSIRLSQMFDGLVQTRMGVCQPFGRELAGKRVKASAWFKGDSLKGTAYVKLWAQAPKIGLHASPGRDLLSGTFDWSYIETEFDVPAGSEIVWSWYLLNAPAEGVLWIDDVGLEVVGDAAPAKAAASGAGLKKP